MQQIIKSNRLKSGLQFEAFNALHCRLAHLVKGKKLWDPPQGKGSENVRRCPLRLDETPYNSCFNVHSTFWACTNIAGLGANIVYTHTGMERC
jgi:hypothetical protein